MQLLVTCDGDLNEYSQFENWIYCSSAWVIDDPDYQPSGDTLIVYEAAPPFDPANVDPAIVSQMFAGGFALVLVPFLAAMGFRFVLRMVR